MEPTVPKRTTGNNEVLQTPVELVNEQGTAAHV